MVFYSVGKKPEEAAEDRERATIEEPRGVAGGQEITRGRQRRSIPPVTVQRPEDCKTYQIVNPDLDDFAAKCT